MNILRGKLPSEMILSFGNGDGDGYGDGYGDGNSYGYGNGNGNGYGDDDGYSDNSIIYWATTLSSVRKEEGTILAYWCSSKAGTPANGGNGTEAFIGLTEEVEGPLKICTKKALHGTLNPPKWKGDRIW